jgi:hypothetical protein
MGPLKHGQLLSQCYKNISNEKWPVKAGTAAEMGPKSGHCRPGAAGFWKIDTG